MPKFPDGVWMAEFSAIADPSLVSTTVAAAVGLQPGAGQISPQLVSQALAHRRLLLILDTCEHVIDAAAAMAEALLQAGSGVRIIATSRESLRAEGEQIYQVSPLALPAVNAEDPWRSGAVRLFVVRSRACGAQVSEDQRVAAAIAGICQQIDGIPLAIELAAARAATMSIEVLAAHLDDRFGLLTGGRRTALPRHRTLRATLDWSHDLLSEPERVILRRLAVFAGAFSMEAAGAIAADHELTPLKVVDGLSNLVAKSLIAAEVNRPVARYRLLDTMRAYALEKLKESGANEVLPRRHAEYYRDLLERAEVEWEIQPNVERLDDYGWCIDNLRAALDWAFSPRGDASVGVALTSAAVPLWMHLSLLDECRGRAEQAIAACKLGDGADARREMKLYTALASSFLWQSSGTRAVATVREQGALWRKALATAESLGDAEYQLRSLWGLGVFHFVIGEVQIALEMAQRLHSLAAQQQKRNGELVGERLMGFLQHLLGDQASARRHNEYVLAHFIATNQRSREVIRLNFDHHVAARTYLARILWLQGFPDEAVRNAEGVVGEACEIKHEVSLCCALAFAACPVMLWVGDLAATVHYTAMLLEHSAKYALPIWNTFGQGFEGVIIIGRGDLGSGLMQLRGVLDEGVVLDCWSMMFFSELAVGLARAGQIAEGLAAAEQAIGRAEQTGARWLFPELLRIRGELLLLQDATGAPAAAEDQFRQSLDWARRQGALSWELRAATSLARLLLDQSRAEDAKALLQPVYDRFTEGFKTADLKAAKALLNTLE
jgi:predicted ATPase